MMMQPVRNHADRKLMRSIWQARLICLLAIGCGGEPTATDTGTDPGPDPGTPGTPGGGTPLFTPGRFALSHAADLSSAAPADGLVGFDDSKLDLTALQVSSFAGPSFDLGTIRATDEFFFILSNAGGASITGITIVSDNPAFEVSPTAISELPPDTGTASVTPVVRVTAVHGIPVSGIGFANLLLAGANNAVIDFNGTTTDSLGASIAVALDATLTVNALLFDIQITDAVGVVDLTMTSGTETGIPEAGGGSVPVIGVQGDILVENTGNVDIVVSANAPVPGSGTPGSGTLTPGTSFAFLAADFPISPLYLIMDGGGTVSDQSRLPILNNGLIILSIRQP